MDNSDEEEEHRDISHAEARWLSEYFDTYQLNAHTHVFLVSAAILPDVRARLERLVQERDVLLKLRERGECAGLPPDPVCRSCVVGLSKKPLKDLYGPSEREALRTRPDLFIRLTRTAIFGDKDGAEGDSEAVILSGYLEEQTFEDLMDLAEILYEAQKSGRSPEHVVFFLQYCDDEDFVLAGDTDRADAPDTLFSPLTSIECSSSTPPPSLN